MGFNFSAESLIAANFFAFCVLAALIVWGCKKLKVSDKLEAQRQKIQDTVDLSEEDKINSAKNLENTKKDFEKLPAEINELKENAKQSGEILAANIIAEAHSKSQIIESNILRAVDYEVKNQKISLTQEISEASLKLAHNNVIELLHNNHDLHHEMINECINEL